MAESEIRWPPTLQFQSWCVWLEITAFNMQFVISIAEAKLTQLESDKSLNCDRAEWNKALRIL